MAESVLDLTTDTERPTVKVDHVPYPLRSADDLTLADFRTIERIGPRIAVLLMSVEMSEADSRELEALLDQGCRIGLAAPTDVHDRLSPLHRVQIFESFAELLSPSLLRTRAILRGSQSPGANSSHGSPASTVATRRRGPHKSRSGPSART